MAQAVYKRGMPVLQQLLSLLLQIFLRDITSVEGDILHPETTGRRESSSEESMRHLADLAQTLSSPDAPPTPEETDSR